MSSPSGWGFPSSTTPIRLDSTPRSSVLSAPRLRFPFCGVQKSLNYTMQHCSQPFGPCVQTDINVSGLVVKGPRVSICPRAPSRSVTPLPLMHFDGVQAVLLSSRPGLGLKDPRGHLLKILVLALPRPRPRFFSQRQGNAIGV